MVDCRANKFMMAQQIQETANKVLEEGVENYLGLYSYPLLYDHLQKDNFRIGSK